ncbi:hypothetical protein [Pararhizobium haloflavum]|uniref:hypothetical protein n=1 Tax=Pararhizobium haloflavum TaxID=2037914 RepID=UPI000C18A29E|nr:hypothetical protein [Pararhizobium haloflavum]
MNDQTSTPPPAVPATLDAQEAKWQLSIRYEQMADRMRFVITKHLPGLSADAPLKTETCECALTRRLCGRMIDAFASLLEKTSSAAATAPAEMRDDMIVFEHQGALSEGKQTATPSAKSASQREPEHRPMPADRLPLVDSVDVALRAGQFHLAVKSAGHPLARLSVGRDELHRIVELMARQADRAGWNLQPETGWLARLSLTADTGAITLN